ncbi:sulfurtransferase TusA family protein [Aurantimonas sp. VKM B-3413]|uniref:sulfurtransferase TusA family protein n=1 Tax=Aurantimonas sp. VKM B-3413 TaxID=2779401 RepID=UPI001E3AF7C7|nr:sulfurtransferase TusA family protein [Aurantimonas sp. VKM B-3413]MCB8839286.1 sulfurtransferase TusA family protein [Aurantimonas sp. VKM B-3413]
MSELDLKGLKCPLPALRTARRLAAMAPGEALVVLADDPMAVIDIPHLCAERGHRLEEVTRTGDVLRFAIVVENVASDRTD